MAQLRPLGIFETAQVLSNDYAAFNVVAILHFDEGPSVKDLRSALQQLQARHPLLRSRIIVQGHRHFFTLDEPGEIPVIEHLRTHDEQWRNLAEYELNQRVDSQTNPPLRCNALVPAESSRLQELVLTFHHAVMDASSGTVLIEELLQLAADPNSENTPTGITEILPPAEQLFPARFKGLRSTLPRVAFLTRQILDEVKYRWGMRKARPAKVAPNWNCRVLTMEIEEGLTSQLVNEARRQRITLNSLLTAAMMMAVHQLLDNKTPRPMRHISFSNLRPYMRPPLSNLPLGGCFGILRSTFFLNEKPEIWSLALAVNSQLHQALRRGDKFVSFLMSRMMMRQVLGQSKLRMGDTAISYSGVLRLKQDYGSFQLSHLHTFVSNFNIGPEYTAQVRLFKSRICWDIVYMDCDMSQELAESIAEHISVVLRDAGERCTS